MDSAMTTTTSLDVHGTEATAADRRTNISTAQSVSAGTVHTWEQETSVSKLFKGNVGGLSSRVMDSAMTTTTSLDVHGTEATAADRRTNTATAQSASAGTVHTWEQETSVSKLFKGNVG